jgi:hypothetical protein
MEKMIKVAVPVMTNKPPTTLRPITNTSFHVGQDSMLSACVDGRPAYVVPGRIKAKERKAI